MANEQKLIDEWSVKDLEDNSSITVKVFHCTELGNQGKPGIQLFIMGRFINFEPHVVEQWAYRAGKNGVTEYFLEDYSWVRHEDQFYKVYLITGDTLKVKIEVKTRSSKPVVKEYELPFMI